MHPEYVNQTRCLLQTSNTLLAKFTDWHIFPSKDSTTAVNKQAARHDRIVVSPQNPAFDQAGRQGQWQSQS